MKSKLLVCHVEGRRISWLRHYLNRLVPKLKRSGVVLRWPRRCVFPNDLTERERTHAMQLQSHTKPPYDKRCARCAVNGAGRMVLRAKGLNMLRSIAADIHGQRGQLPPLCRDQRQLGQHELRRIVAGVGSVRGVRQ